MPSIHPQWVAESSPTHSTPVRIDDALQFVPPNTNPKEFKRVQQQVSANNHNLANFLNKPPFQILAMALFQLYPAPFTTLHSIYKYKSFLKTKLLFKL